MPHAGRFALFVAIAGSVASACAGKQIPAPTPPKPTLVMLLPDADTGTTGRARVSNEFGSVDLTVAGDVTRARPDGAPAPVRRMDKEQASRMFDGALAALPPPSRRFTLRFRFESDELTEESRAQVPEILNAVKSHPVPEVVVVGHTDTMGEAQANVALGMKRATTVQGLLVDAGIDRSIIDVSSHGEADPLIKTRDNQPEPRNRRVEILVR